MKQLTSKTLAITSALSVASAMSMGAAQANPFEATELSSGYEMSQPQEMKCGEGKCGA